MSAFEIAIDVGWAVFWFCWMTAALGAKPGSRAGGTRLRGASVVGVFVMVRVLRIGNLAVHNTAVAVAGTTLFAAGLGLALWARWHMGRNWGMPMTRKDEPELVTSGPYRLIRHPIYSGILLAVLGNALAVNLDWLILLALLTAYFVRCATVEERLMTSQFPTVYPSYRDSTRMLVPYLI